MSKQVYIYALSDPRDGNIRYVGKCTSPSKRIYKHLRDNRNNPRVRWIRELISNDILPEMIIVDSVAVEDWELWEQHYISLMRSWGFSLTNRSYGGAGAKHVLGTGDIISKRKTTLNSEKELPPVSKEKIASIYKASVPKKISNELAQKRTAHFKKPIVQLTISGEVVKEWDSSASARKHTGISSICQALSGLYATAGGYVWKRKETNS